MSRNTAFLFDLNGTMIDDMNYHLDVWYDIIVNEYGAKLSREEVKHHMYGKSQELLVRIFGRDRFTPEGLDAISGYKERLYQMQYRPHLDLIPGLFAFLEEAHEQQIPMAIGSAAIPFNISFVLDNLKISHYFRAVVSADDVINSKPDPETYLKAAKLLNVDPGSCIVFEDVPKGVQAAQLAGMKAVVLTTTHPQKDFVAYNNIIMFCEDYQSLSVSGLLTKSARTVANK